MSVRIAVIVLNYNGREDSLRCLDSVYRLRYPAFEAVFVDNGSSDGSVAAVKERFPRTTVIENGGNLGFAAGNNRGIEYAIKEGFSYVLLLNNDAVIDPEACGILASEAERDSSIAAAGPAIFYLARPDTLWSAGGWIDWKRGIWGAGRKRPLPEALCEVDALSGCCLLLRVSALARCCLFNEKLFLYGEDIDLCWRLKKTGMRNICVPRARVWHAVGGTMSSGSAAYAYYTTRNRLYFMKEHCPLRMKPVFWSYFLLTGMRWMWSLALAGKTSVMRAAARGVTDFFLGKAGRLEGAL